LTAGKLTDLVILDRDPCTVESEDLHMLRADLTMIDGRVAFERA
jgi:predicted amidohydrolase YtcJ